jgi:hypothetical protein
MISLALMNESDAWSRMKEVERTTVDVRDTCFTFKPTFLSQGMKIGLYDHNIAHNERKRILKT